MTRCSILIPAYNNTEEQKIKLLNSINSQTIINQLQVILVDDGSNIDKQWTEQYLKENLLCPFKLQVQKINYGVGITRQNLLNLIDTEFFCFIDSDDIFCDNTILEQYITFLDNNLDYDMVRSNTQILYGNNSYIINDEGVSSNALHGLCGRSQILKDYQLNFPNCQYHEDTIFYYLLHIYEIKIKTLNCVGYSQEDSYLAKKVHPILMQMNDLNSCFHAIHFLTTRVQQQCPRIEHHISMIATLLQDFSKSLENQYVDSEQNFIQGDIPDEIYYLWKKYYYITWLKQTPFNLLLFLQRQYNIDTNLLSFINSQIFGYNLYYNKYTNTFITYEQIEQILSTWLDSYAQESKWNIPHQLIRNFPWHYKSLN